MHSWSCGHCQYACIYIHCVHAHAIHYVAPPTLTNQRAAFDLFTGSACQITSYSGTLKYWTHVIQQIWNWNQKSKMCWGSIATDPKCKSVFWITVLALAILSVHMLTFYAKKLTWLHITQLPTLCAGKRVCYFSRVKPLSPVSQLLFHWCALCWVC